jgi:hypothetical protein
MAMLKFYGKALWFSFDELLKLNLRCDGVPVDLP